MEVLVDDIVVVCVFVGGVWVVVVVVDFELCVWDGVVDGVDDVVVVVGDE